uniref:Selenocysteine lyase n=1 Tax=Chelydra serpentina TaxID=8475 RepID=A0A8C3SKH2_CHESE
MQFQETILSFFYCKYVIKTTRSTVYIDPTGRKAKEIINEARESLAQMVVGRPQDIIFTSGGTEANNLVIHTALRHFRESQVLGQDGPGEDHKRAAGTTPHFITSNVEHDSVRLPLEHLVKEHLAEATFVPVSKITGQVEVDDVIAAICPTTCLVSIMLANNETGVIMPISELSQRIQILNQNRMASGLPRILMHTDAAQMIGKGRVDGQDLGVDYLTIVGHKFYAPRIGALYVRGPGVTTPLHPMLFGGGQERNFRPGEVRDYLEERLEASFGKHRLHLNSQFPGAKRLCNTCNFSVWGPGLVICVWECDGADWPRTGTERVSPSLLAEEATPLRLCWSCSNRESGIKACRAAQSGQAAEGGGRPAVAPAQGQWWLIQEGAEGPRSGTRDWQLSEPQGALGAEEPEDPDDTGTATFGEGVGSDPGKGREWYLPPL